MAVMIPDLDTLLIALLRQLQFVVIMMLSRRRRSSVGGPGGHDAGGGVARPTSAADWGPVLPGRRDDVAQQPQHMG